MECERMKELRENPNVTQAQIANSLGISKTVYAKYESGERKIPLQIAILLTEYYKVSMDYLAGLTEIKERR